MKAETMNYDAIYQETASNLLLQARQLKVKVEMKQERVEGLLRSRIIHQLHSMKRFSSDNPFSLWIGSSPGCRSIDIQVEALGVPRFQESHTILNNEEEEPGNTESLAALCQKEWFPSDFPIGDLQTLLRDLRQLVIDHEEASRKYMELETSHLTQFADYARNRIDKEEVIRHETHYRFLCAIDTFCSSEDEGFFSGQTMVLVRQDWPKFVTPELAELIRNTLEDANAAETVEVRELLSHAAFLSCKVGSYYPLTFEQLWDQMVVGMNLRKNVII